MFNEIDLTKLNRVIFSDPKKDSKYKKGKGIRIQIKNNEIIQFELFTDKQAFHYNVSFDELINF